VVAAGHNPMAIEIDGEGFDDPIIAHVTFEKFEDPIIALKKLGVFEDPFFFKLHIKGVETPLAGRTEPVG
jgi:hypothetical protein